MVRPRGKGITEKELEDNLEKYLNESDFDCEDDFSEVSDPTFAEPNIDISNVENDSNGHLSDSSSNSESSDSAPFSFRARQRGRTGQNSRQRRRGRSRGVRAIPVPYPNAQWSFI
ncbi:hypothetical protein ACJJTC_011909 [Scirpophaga incertulas]